MANSSNWTFSIYRTIATVGIFLILTYSIFVLGDEYEFVHFPSMIFIFGLTFFLLLGTFQFDFLRFIPASLKMLCCTPRKPNPRFAEIARFASRYVIGMAVICTLIGLINMLRSLDIPDQIGLSIAVALLPVLYAVILSEVFFALAYKTFSRQSEQENSKPLSAKGIALLMAVVGLILVRFCLAIIAYNDV
ncbi:MAG: MotA/TolQ/ExbB proton channel family protein [Planctomycetota bacterium]